MKNKKNKKNRKNMKNKNKKTKKQLTKKEKKLLKIVKTDKSYYSIIIEKMGFINIDKDKDGLYNGLIIPKTHANYLFYTSFFSMLSSIFLFYKKNNNCIYTLLIFITSINYWRNPVYDWRRTIDILVTVVSFCFIGKNFYIQSQFIDFLQHTIISLLFYLISNYFQEDYIHLCTFFHSLIHIYPNIKFIIYEIDKG